MNSIDSSPRNPGSPEVDRLLGAAYRASGQLTVLASWLEQQRDSGDRDVDAQFDTARQLLDTALVVLGDALEPAPVTP